MFYFKTVAMFIFGFYFVNLKNEETKLELNLENML